MKVYLAGGFYTNWQKRVMDGAPEHIYHNPMLHSRQLTTYSFVSDDLNAVHNSDVVFVHFEKTNPTGIGLAVEVGYAVALGIPVMYVDDHPRINEFLAGCAKRVFSDLDTAIEFLRDRGI